MATCLMLLGAAGLLGACDGTSSQSSEPDTAKAAATAAPEAASDAVEPTTAETCTLVMGWDPWMPYQYRAANGSVTGLDIEIASAAAAAAGCALETRQDSWVAHLKSLESGELDFVGGASRTPAREAFAWFTEPYRSESFVVFVSATSAAEQGESLSDVLENGKRVGTVAGFYYGGAVAELQESGNFDGQFTDADISELNFHALVNGEIDAVLEDPYVGAAILRTEGLADAVIESDVVLATGEVSFMFSKAGTSEAEFQRFSAALSDMKASGALAAILDRYRE